MTTDIRPVLFDEAADTWEVVSNCLERFVHAWDSGTPPELEPFLPQGPAAVRRLALIELIKIDIEHRLQHSSARPLEDYLRAFPELDEGGVPCDLLYEDFHLRRQHGEAVAPEDYFRRFPERARDLAQLLGGSGDKQTTSILAARLPVTLRPGERIDDFELLALLGEGRFAQVFLARQVSMQRLVALKISRPRGAEAQTLAQLDHPHIVRVFDQRLLEDRDLLLVYMPYLPGGTLQDVLEHVRGLPPDQLSGRALLAAVDAALERHGEQPPAVSTARRQWAQRSWPATVCALGAKLARALAYAHRRHVLHRDIKPPNVLLSAEGEPLLADFNVGCCSKLDGAGPAALFGGSLSYMAPEHLEAFNPEHPRQPDSLDARADLYSLAVTLWELRALSRPFAAARLGATWQHTLAALTRERRDGPSIGTMLELQDGDARGLRQILLRCLEPDLERRPPDAATLACELEMCLRPATCALVRPRPNRWRDFVQRHPLLVTLPAGLVPNILAAIFNISYDRTEIVEHWQQAASAFDRIIPIVNGIFFPLGMLLWALVIVPVGAGLRRLERGERVPAERLTWLRQRTLRLGHLAALVCVGCWLVAGAVWPLALRALAGPPPGVEAYVHFMLSLTVCGLVVAAYPYFVIAYISVHVLYPALLGSVGPVAGDAAGLQRLRRELGVYRAVATAVPLLALVFLVTMRGSSNALAIAVLSLTGLAGTVISFALERRISADLAALTEAAQDDVEA